MGELIYTPTKGYFDLTERPKSMSAKFHKKLQETQMTLIAEVEKYKDPEVRKNNSATYQKLVQYMAELQSIVLNHYPHEMLFKD